MQFYDFILENKESILGEWEEFARSLPPGKSMNVRDLRDDAESILKTIAQDMKVAESDKQQKTKSRGEAGLNVTAMKFGHRHAVERYEDGFNLDEVVAEYRALRAVVIRKWTEKMKSADAQTLYQLTRFNEGLDQALTYTISQYVKTVTKNMTILTSELQEANLNKTEFLAMLSHEFGILLTPLTNTLEGIKRSVGHNKLIYSACWMMERQLNLLAYLVEDLVHMGRENKRKLDLHLESVILQSIIDEAVNTCSALPKWQSQHLEMSLPPRPIYLDADPLRLLQVFYNLLNNASKFTPPGGKISIIVEREYNEVVIKISDTGSGIDPRQLRSVFELIAPAIDSRKETPCGAGLVLVKRLVEMHKGTVEAQSQGPGLGCHVVVRIPMLLSKAKESLFQ